MSHNAPISIVLALGLGASLSYALSSQTAEGYPTTAVSTGANPVVAKGGYVIGGSSTSPFVAPSGHKIIVTDVVLTIYGNSGSTTPCNNRVSIDTAAGAIAEYRLSSDTYHNNYYLQPTSVSHSYSSGLPLEPEDTLVVTNHGGDCDISYSLSGYLAQL